jgi:hypothetical protein
MSGTHFNGECCFDYGNSENTRLQPVGTGDYACGAMVRDLNDRTMTGFQCMYGAPTAYILKRHVNVLTCNCCVGGNGNRRLSTSATRTGRATPVLVTPARGLALT